MRRRSTSTATPAGAQAGFTLIEVLVALALMALVSLMAWRGLDSVSSARDWIEQQADDTDAIVRTLGQMARDVELSYTGPSFDAAGKDDLTFTSGLRLLRRASGGQTLELLRPDPDGNGLWQRVHWQVRADGLWRATGPAAAQSPLPAAVDGALLLAGVRSLKLRAWVPGIGWVDANSSFAATPTGIEITLERGAASAPQRYVRVLELP
ncbi:type II secretion system protein GspJ [Achromobacter seleniivolatilans]|uniref:Type II secretion system protein J n=1 Tax=Achromobacter seleniivolatilans TaxID=3047478 RepID=A0ABY9MA78_9BURK|nr:type II secretion system protein GspJ [Achromobacter sp. R39]WMD22682.1 type II secretion system protein GspJ [Achromobacter sp. R39]